MMWKSTLILAALLIAVMITPASGGEAVSWGYSGNTGPQRWGELNPEFRLCAEGRNQSPVDLDTFIEAGLKRLNITYSSGAREIVNNGHTIQINVEPGSFLALDGKVFGLKQFHFHSPAENRIRGQVFPLEAHFVHQDDKGNLAVIAVVFEQRRENRALSELWRQMPASHAGKNNATKRLVRPFNPEALLPLSKQYYRFNGSLTTPPCSEGVRWLVMKRPVQISRAQVQAFRNVMRHDNNRPVQPLHARVIMK